jgi:hypothetical protein
MRNDAVAAMEPGVKRAHAVRRFRRVLPAGSSESWRACALASRRRVPSPAARPWLCRVWSDFGSSDVSFDPMRPWMERAWGGVRRLLMNTMAGARVARLKTLIHLSAR